MKKFLKFVAGVTSVAAVACGIYFFCKKYICKETPDDFDDFDDDLDDCDTTEEPLPKKENREYVSINITSDSDQENNEESAKEDDSNKDEQQEP